MSINIDKIEVEGLAAELGAEIGDIGLLFAEYLKEMDSEISEIDTQLTNLDWKAMQRTVHNIKGVSINLNLFSMHKYAEIIDLSLKSENTQGIEKEIENLKEVFGITKKSIIEDFKRLNISF